MTKYEYLISSERAKRRTDERNNMFLSNKEYKVGDTFELDGINWTITKIVKGCHENKKKCNLIDGHVCPQKSNKSNEGSRCDGCILFEAYLNFKERSMKIEESEVEK